MAGPPALCITDQSSAAGFDDLEKCPGNDPISLFGGMDVGNDISAARAHVRQRTHPIDVVREAVGGLVIAEVTRVERP